VNARVDYTVQTDTIISSVKEILLKQILTFSTLPATKYKATPFKLEASSDTNLPIEYISSDPAIAEIDGDTVFLVGVGEVTITAVQTGDETREPASAQQRLIVGKADQTISFDLLPAMTYNDVPFALPEFTSAGLSVVYTSSNEAIAKIVDGKISITGAGEAVITALQEGNALYLTAERREQNLVVLKDDQTIPFEIIPIQIAKEFITLPEYSSANLPIRYASDNEVVATIAGNVITILESGEATITATQEGDQNYEAAPSIQQVLRVAIVLGIEKEPSFLTIGPNPTTGNLKINSVLPIQNISITDITGRSRMLTLQDSELDICSFAPGIYMLLIQASDKIEMRKIVKE
jgi:hypothetical protein